MVASETNQYTSVFEEDDSHQFLGHAGHPGEDQRTKLNVLTSTASVTNNFANSELNVDPWEMDQSQGPPVGVGPHPVGVGSGPGGANILELKETNADEELENYFKDNETDNQKLSQLRHMLEKNLKSPSLNQASVVKPMGWNANAGSNVSVMANSEANSVMTSNQTPLNTRRRVSFIDPLIGKFFQSHSSLTSLTRILFEHSLSLLQVSLESPSSLPRVSPKSSSKETRRIP